MPTVDVAYLEKQAVLYDNFGSGRPYPGLNSSESSGDLAPTPRASRTPVTTTRRTPAVPRVALVEPSPPNRPASRASSRRGSVASIRSLDPSSPNDGAVPFIPPSPSQFQIPTSQHDFRIVKNPPSIASQSRMSTVGRMPTNPPDRTPGASNYFSSINPGFVANATPARMNQPFSVASTVRNLAGGTQGAPSVRVTPARLPATMNSTTTTIRRLPAALPSRGTGRTTTSELPRLSMNFDSTSNAPAGFVPQASPAMFDASSAMPATTGGMFMGRTPVNPMGGLPNEPMSFPSPGFVPQPPTMTSHTAGTFMGRTPAHHMESLSNEPMSHPAPGFIPQPPVMSATTPHMGGMFMDRTPGNAMGGLPNSTPASTNINVSNAANFKTGSAREPVTQTTTKEPARLPSSRRPSISASSTGRMPARLPSFTGGESSQQAQPPPQQFQFPGFSQYDFGSQSFGGGGPFGGGGSSDPNAFKATPASIMRNMSNVRAPARLPGHSSTNAPARLPDRNSTINTPARLPLPPSHVNTPWSMGGQLTNPRPPATLHTPGSRQQGFIPPSPHTSAAPTPGRSGLGLPTGGSRGESHRGSPVRSSSPYRAFDASTYVDPATIHFPPSRPSSRAGSVRSAQGTTFRPMSSYLLPPGGKVIDTRNAIIESASDEDD
ncbi:hypothetical protein Clacol_007234 [Clathrus columnatus]|uniref:Uncharacterized protein n=1 Tax=Clathrus columnatus TaxID=1419009 RepID=A0AAV5AH70_9AGAM|nr:hypothetical protein Clacol_007234 [Clathrus columnatus]